MLLSRLDYFRREQWIFFPIDILVHGRIIILLDMRITICIKKE